MEKQHTNQLKIKKILFWGLGPLISAQIRVRSNLFVNQTGNFIRNLKNKELSKSDLK
jgi:hypothetical protein